MQSYLKIIVILYADDTVLFAENENELQDLLNEFQNYCNIWKLDINTEKTKIVIFGDRTRRHNNILIDNKPIEIVDSFKYLGILLPKTRNFLQTKKHAADQARKALFGLYQKIRNLELPIDCQLKLFDSMILPILTYGCEVWGFGDLSVIEKVHTDFMKRILNVKRSTPHVMLYGELGRYPVILTIQNRIINFGSKMLVGQQTKLSYRLYKILLSEYEDGRYAYPWISNVKSIFDKVGMSEIWINQNPFNTTWLTKTVQFTLEDQYKQIWSSTVQESSKCLNYRVFKSVHKFESYLVDLPPKLRKCFINFRLCNHTLPIEKGRWHNIDRNLRKCNLCLKNEIGDEFHYAFECPAFDLERSLIVPFMYKKKNK